MARISLSDIKKAINDTKYSRQLRETYGLGSKPMSRKLLEAYAAVDLGASPDLQKQTMRTYDKAVATGWIGPGGTKGTFAEIIVPQLIQPASKVITAEEYQQRLNLARTPEEAAQIRFEGLQPLLDKDRNVISAPIFTDKIGDKTILTPIKPLAYSTDKPGSVITMEEYNARLAAAKTPEEAAQVRFEGLQPLFAPDGQKVAAPTKFYYDEKRGINVLTPVMPGKSLGVTVSNYTPLSRPSSGGQSGGGVDYNPLSGVKPKGTLLSGLPAMGGVSGNLPMTMAPMKQRPVVSSNWIRENPIKDISAGFFNKQAPMQNTTFFDRQNPDQAMKKAPGLFGKKISMM